MLNRQTFLFFLQKVTGQSYFRKKNGSIDYTSVPTWLPNAPKEWFESVLTWARNKHYWGMNRSFSNEYTFYKDGQDIINDVLFKPTGISDPLNLIVNKYNPQTGEYDPYFKGEVDLPHAEDNPVESTKVPIIEGGLPKLIKAFENTYFEIPVDGSIPENLSVKMDGYLFHTTLTYAVVPFQVKDQGIIIPLIQSDSTGNDIGVIKGQQKYESFDRTNYTSNMAVNKNNTFSSYKALTVTVQGPLLLGGSLTNGNLFLYTSFGQKVDLIPKANLSAAEYDFSQSITIAPGENLFILLTSEGGTPNISLSDIQIIYDSKLDITYCYAIRPYDLLKLLLKKICQMASTPGRQISYNLVSTLLQQNANLCITSGMALQNQTKAVIKTKLSDFYDSFDAVLSACMGVELDENGVQQLFFERLGYTLDSTAVDMNVGEASGFKILMAKDKYFDSVSFGYPEQKYDDKQANQEFNTTSRWKVPLTPFSAVQQEYKKVSIFRADMFGIESTRKNINSASNTSNNKSNNDVFFINTDLTQTDSTSVIILSAPSTIKSNNGQAPLNQIAYSSINGTGIASDFSKATVNSTNDTIRYSGINTTVKIIASISGTYLPTTYSYHTGIGFLGSWHDYYYPQVDVYIQFVYNGKAIDQVQRTFYAGKPFSYTFLENLNLSFGDSFFINIVPVDITQPYLFNSFSATATAQITMQTDGTIVYGLKRATYDAITGILNPSSVYNLEDLSPMIMLKNHGDYIRSVYFNYTQLSLFYQTTDKNRNISRTLNGVTITECTNVPIGSLNPNILFLPFYLQYKTYVPDSFNSILNNAANGHIQNTFIGINAYGFPEEVKQKPAINEAQDWTLLCSPKTSLSDLLNIEFNAINTIELMANGAYFSYLNPVKWYPYTLTKSAQYNFTHMDEDEVGIQTENLRFPAEYLQKWQQNDTWVLQCISNGLSPVSIDIVDISITNDINTGRIVATFTLTNITDPAVTTFSLFQGQYALAGLPEGIYQLRATIGTGTVVLWKSNKMAVAALWPNTGLLEYSDTRNKWSTIFTAGYKPQFRVESNLGKFNVESKYSQFEDQSGDIEMINGIPVRTFSLIVGWRSSGVPPWVRELLEYILLLETSSFDGLGITRDISSKFEEEEINGWPFSVWKMKVRQSKNKFGISVTTDGNVNDQMLVTYPINTLLMGDGNVDNTITITDYE